MPVMQYFLTGLFLAIVFFDNVTALQEPVCSKFDYEMKTLEAMLRIENRAEKMMEELKSVRDSMTKELDEIKNLKAEVERQQTAMEIKITALESEIEDVPDEVIAFSVANPTKELGSGVPTFKTVITNRGNGYDVKTGIFTCPIGGLYMFIFNLASSGKYYVYCLIRHNGVDKVYGGSYNDNAYTTASASVNLLLQKGDLVTLGGCGGWNNVHETNGYTTYSGALLQKIDMEN